MSPKPSYRVHSLARCALAPCAAIALGTLAAAGSDRVAVQTQRLFSPYPLKTSGFAKSAAIDGDRIVVGNPDRQLVYVYERDGGKWVLSVTLQSRYTPDEVGYFGAAVALDGDVLVVGGTRWGGSDTLVTAWVYEHDGSSWVNTAERGLDGSDGLFGTVSVAIDGDRIAVGAPLDLNLQDRGRVAVLERGAGDWPIVCTFVAPTSEQGDYLGWSVDVEGALVLAGAPNADAAYLVDAERDCALLETLVDSGGSTSGLAFGWSVALSGGRAAIGARVDPAGGAQAGAVSIFEESGGAWGFVEKLVPAGVDAGDWYGYSVDLDGDVLVAGAARDTVHLAEEGAVYFHVRDGGAWSPGVRLTAVPASAGARFGAVSELDGGTFVVGAPLGSTLEPDAGLAYVFEHGPEQGTSYCVAGVNSTGLPARIDAFGSLVAAEDDFHLFAVGALPAQHGLFLFGPNPAQVPLGDGFRCVGSPVFRLFPVAPADNSGTAYHRVSMGSDPALGQIVEQVPIRMHFQYWYRDFGSTNLTDGLMVDFR